MVEGLDMTLEQIIQKNKDKEKETKMRLQQDGNSGGGRGSGTGDGTGRGNVTGGSGGRKRNRGRENRVPPPWTAGGRRFSMDRNASNLTPYFKLPPPPPAPLLPTPPPPPPPLPPIEVLQERQIKTTAVKRRLLVYNLHFEVTENDIKVLFSDVGPLECYILHYDKSGRSKGTAEVVYERTLDAAEAYIRYNNLCLDGRKLKLEFGVDQSTPPSPPAQKDIGSSSGLNQRFASSAPCDVGDKYNKGTYAMRTPENEPALEAGEWVRFKNAPFPRGDCLATYGSGASQLTDDYQGFQTWDDFRGPGPQRTDWKQFPVTFTDDSRGFQSRNFRSNDWKQGAATFTDDSRGFQSMNFRSADSKQGAYIFNDDTKGFPSRNFRIQGPQRADRNQRKVPERQRGNNKKNVSAEELDADLDNYCKRQRKFTR